MQNNIILAKTAGFCFGVKRAVEMAQAAAKNDGDIYMLGSVIHNESVVNNLLSLGIKQIDRLDQAKKGGYVIIRAHGVGKDTHEQAAALGIKMIDTTCPFVKKIHKVVNEGLRDGFSIFIAGDPKHPEVEGINGWCENEGYIFNSLEELEDFTANHPDYKEKKIIMVSQTTFNRKIFDFMIQHVNKNYTNLVLSDTICNATDERQSEAVDIAEKSDIMFVVGSFKSSNTKKLFDICSKKCEYVYLINSASDITTDMLSGGHSIGITAGASTPAFIIKEVIHTMDLEKNQGDTETAEMSFAEAFEKSIKTLNTGDIVTGVVVGIAPNEIHVDLGTKHDGYIPVNELSDDPEIKPEDFVKVGQEIEAFVVRVNDVEGTIMLSKKKVDSIKGWQEIEKACEDQTILPCTVIEAVKGGVIALTNGVRVFVPASLAALRYTKDLQTLVGQKTQLRIIEINRQRRRLTGSIKSVLEEERKEKEEVIWSAIEEGKVYHGVVKSITSYGVFVDIGGVDGMVHMSELSWSRIKHPSDVVSIDDQIEVYVLKFDKETRKISLGYKKPEDNPWDIFKGQYKTGDVVHCKIIKLMPFGAFAEIISGVDGLIHISQIADRRIAKPGDVLTTGEFVDAKIMEINDENKKVSLSIRALLEPELPQNQEEEVSSTEDEPKEQEAAQVEEPKQQPEESAE